jgi:hypothetical protein
MKKDTWIVIMILAGAAIAVGAIIFTGSNSVVLDSETATSSLSDASSSQPQVVAETATAPKVNTPNKTVHVSKPIENPAPAQPSQPKVTPLAYCQNQNGPNATYNPTNNSCGCATGYELNSNNICTVKKSGYQVCGDMDATWDGSSYTSSGGFNCACKTGYISGSDGKSCVVAPVKTGYQVCGDMNAMWDGTYRSGGEFNCVCQTGYESNSSGTSCQPQQQASPSSSVACQTAQQNLATFIQQHPITSPVGEGNTAIMLQSIAAQQSALAQAAQWACRY